MARARDRWGRAIQVTKWLRKTFPTPHPVTVRWATKLDNDWEDEDLMTEREKAGGIYGMCFLKKRRFCIVLSKKRCQTISDTIDTLLHEWAHAVTWRVSKMEYVRLSCHDDEFFLQWGRIYRRYLEGDIDKQGWVVSGKYKF